MMETKKQKRLRVKQELLKIHGNKCSKCNYSKSLSALCFHHKEPKEKAFNISGVQLSKKAINTLKEEANKCIVYCLNCHAELHDTEGWVHEEGKRSPK